MKQKTFTENIHTFLAVECSLKLASSMTYFICAFISFGFYKTNVSLVDSIYLLRITLISANCIVVHH